MKKVSTYLLPIFIGALIFLNACDDSGDNPTPPKATGPTTITGVQAGASADINFNVTTAAGYKSAAVSTIGGGSADIASEPAVGAASGTIVVNYTAAATAGADQVNLIVSDNSSQTATASATIEVTTLPPPPPNVVLSGVITEDMTLTADRIYELAGRVIVDAGVTLTIEPGTILKGREGQGVSASALIISQGGMIDAEGTAEKPIIFTSILDNIEVGEFNGTNLTKEDNEKWGGLIMLGYAPISAKNGDTESTIEGLPAEEPFAKYGGDDPADNSGILKYVSIRHGGITIGDGNEINGLTLGGVGSATVIENVEIYATLDDGIEFFGGTVDVTNAIVAWQGDDGFDIDQNYSGTVDNFAVTHGIGVNTDEGLEIDGPEGSTYTTGLFTLMNGTIANDGNEGTPGDFKDKAQGTVDNVVFTGYASTGNKIAIRASFTNDCMDPKADSYTNLTQASPTLIFTGSNFEGNMVYTTSTNTAETETCTVPAEDQTTADGKMVSDAAATGADMSVFDWTLSKKDGLID